MSGDINSFDEREEKILILSKDIKDSGLSEREYFSTHNVPFSLRQYQNYKKAYSDKGLIGLCDHRIYGNAKKITSEITHYLLGLLENNLGLSTQSIITQIEKRFEVKLKPRTINNFRKDHGLERIKKPVSHTEYVQFAGFEIISALAYYTGILNVWSGSIEKQVEDVKGTDLFKHNQSLGADHPSARKKCKFTPRYNKLKSVCSTKFNSVEDKAQHKDISRLQILNTQAKTLTKKISPYYPCR